MSIHQRGTQLLFLSHGAGTGLSGGRENVETDWFIVEPRDDHEPLMRQVESLRRAGRTVRRLIVTPYEGRNDLGPHDPIESFEVIPNGGTDLLPCGHARTGTTPGGTPECGHAHCNHAIESETHDAP